MRVVAQIPHADFTITLFAWNGKYLLKFETPLLEQTYKVREADVTGDADVIALVKDTAFMQAVTEQFMDMQATLEEAASRLF